MSITDTLNKLHGPPDEPEKPQAELPDIRKVINAFATGQGPQSLKQDWLRASGLYFMCPREFVLNYWKPTPSVKFTGDNLMKMACGTWWHWHMQNKVLGPLGVLKGCWVNSVSDVYNRENSWHPDPELALQDEAHQLPVWQFYEAGLTEQGWRMTGHHDGLVSVDRLRWLADNLNVVRKDLPSALKEVQAIPVGELALLELKSQSISAAEHWQTADETPDYYKMQANIYQHMTGIHKTIFLLADRDEFKCRLIQYDYDDAWWQEATRKATTIWTAIRDRTLPDNCPCRDRDFWRAKKCVFRKSCWDEGDFAAWVKLQADSQPDRKWLNLADWMPPE